MTTKQRLELTWIGKENRPKLEPRILLEDPEKSYHAEHRVTEDDIFDNRLIFGDNLLALKSLEQEFAGKVRCVFIDPPYNTGSAFTHYDDGLEHSIWLSLMRDRLELLRRLLSDNGSLWITIDDNEAHYLKVLCDEVFGRANYIATAIWQKALSVKNSTRHFSVDHDYILVYAKNEGAWVPNRVPAGAKQVTAYKNPDNDPRGEWQSISLSARNPYSKGLYSIRCPGGRFISGPPAGSYWRVSEEKFWELDSNGEIWWGQDRNGMPRRKMYRADQGELTKAPQTIWFFEDVGHTQDAKKEALALNSEDVFATPKPERLMKRIIEIATNRGDLIVDSFAGSGTTALLRKRWADAGSWSSWASIATRISFRDLKKVIDGEDTGGVTKAVDWKGGGGFRYYRLAPSLLEKDKWGNWVISKEYNAAMLAEALCKLEGFTYAPSDIRLLAARSLHRAGLPLCHDAQLNHEQLQQLSDEVGSEQDAAGAVHRLPGQGRPLSRISPSKRFPSRCSRAANGATTITASRCENLPKAAASRRASSACLVRRSAQ